MTAGAFSVHVNPGRSVVRVANTVLNGRPAGYHDPGFETGLTVKSVVRGEAWYQTRRARYRVDAERVVVLDRGTEYSLDIYPQPRTETLAVFFADGFVEHVAALAERGPAALLDDPEARAAPRPFVERSHDKHGRAARTLRTLHAALRADRGEPMALEEPFYALAAELLRWRDQDASAAGRVAAARASTRTELYRRVHRVRDCIEASLRDPWTVVDLAGVACMSPYHFQRTFAAVFGISAGRYLQQARMRAAADLLRRGGAPVADVAAAVGYASPATFSRVFRRHFGCAPSAWRRSRPT